ncbi:MAG: methanol dehydrogenase [Caulobacterales bacterium 68-7]|nr:TPM domain-containing protein [Caulobacterales bacterium]OJU09729.1 MAG: methanol dehydrogenase [Caulobacterales bacterium 68-7]
MLRLLRWKAALGACAVALVWIGAAFAAPTFPALTGRVVDEAGILSPQTEAALTAKLDTLERESGRQLVVATLPSLQGYDIADYGYQLGRSWGIGDQKADNGALLIVAPTERKVRIEVGYGLEPVLTDAMSSVILQGQVLPRFKAGDMEGGVVAGVDSIAQQLALPPDEAKARAERAGEARRTSGDAGSSAPVILALILFAMIFLFTRGRRRSGLGGALPWIVLSALSNSGRGGGWSGGGGFRGGGGGGFSGGGGSFGGGGSSGSW